MNKFPTPNKEQLTAILETCREKTDDDKPTTKTNQNPEEAVENSFAAKAKRAFIEFKLLCKNYVNLVKTPELRRRSLLMWSLFISVTLVYYGISFASPSLSDDPFLVVFLG